MNIVIYKVNPKLLLWTLAVILNSVLLAVIFVQQNTILQDGSPLEKGDGHDVPSNVHFVLGQGGINTIKDSFASSSEFSFIHYLTILAARRHLRPNKLYMHYYEEPNTFWWYQTKRDPEIDITLIKSRLVQSMFMKSVDHPAHHANIIRLEVMIKYGGIYLELDVLTLRSFDPILNMSDVVMINQSNDPNTACNTVIIGKRNATFLRRLHDTFQTFDQNCRDCHTATIQRQLAMIYPQEVMLLPANTFFYSTWSERSRFFQINDYNFTSLYAFYLSNKVYNRYLHDLTSDKILNGNFPLARILRQSIGSATFHKLKQFFVNSSIH